MLYLYIAWQVLSSRRRAGSGRRSPGSLASGLRPGSAETGALLLTTASAKLFVVARTVRLWTGIGYDPIVGCGAVSSGSFKFNNFYPLQTQ